MPTSVTNYQDVTVLTPKDDLAGDEVSTFVERFSAAPGRSFVVDFTHVGGIDSQGLEALIDFQNKAAEQQGVVKLCGLDDSCRKILEITRLLRRFEVCSDLESAVKSFH